MLHCDILIQEQRSGLLLSELENGPNFVLIWHLTPIRATWSSFSEVEIQDLKVSLELRILYILYNILYICNLKNS